MTLEERVANISTVPMSLRTIHIHGKKLEETISVKLRSFEYMYLFKPLQRVS